MKVAEQLNSKVCTSCNSTKPISEYSSNQSKCKPCNALATAEWRRNNREKVKAYNKYYFKEVGYTLSPAQKERARIRNRERIRENREGFNEKRRAKRDCAKEYRSGNKIVRRLHKERNLGGHWDKEVKNFISNKPEGHSVDHIIPLRSEIVSGLHVPWNLQYLSRLENSLKGNSFDGTNENLSWKYRS